MTIPIVLVTGFLGSGKTSLLRHWAGRYAARRLVYLVNEFSAVDVDAAELQRVTPDVVSLPGGSIFCRCLISEFLDRLALLPERFAAPGRPIEAVIVEASGMANPSTADRLLRESGLDLVYDLRRIVALADPGSFRKLLRTLPAIRDQVAAADLVVLNKTDRYPEADVAATERAILDVRPGAPIVRTTFGRIDLDLPPPAGARTSDGEYATCADPRFAREAVRVDGEVDLAAFRAAVDAVADDVYRLKGRVRSGGAMRHVEFSASGWDVSDEAAPGEPELVFILRGADHAGADRVVADLRAGRFAPPAAPPR